MSVVRGILQGSDKIDTVIHLKLMAITLKPEKPVSHLRYDCSHEVEAASHYKLRVKNRSNIL